MLYIYHKKLLIKWQHELVANDIESDIVSVQEINRKGSLVARTCAPTWRACGVQD